MKLPSVLKSFPIYIILSIMTVALIIFLAQPDNTRANSLTEATNSLCSQIKSCTAADLEQQQLPPAMQKMMLNVLDNTCAKTVAPYAEQAISAGLENAALACIESVKALSCDALMKTKEAETKECKTLETAANEAGIDTSHPSL